MLLSAEAGTESAKESSIATEKRKSCKSVKIAIKETLFFFSFS